LSKRTKAHERCFDLIWAKRKVRQRVKTGLIRKSSPRSTDVRLSCCDLHAGQDSATRVSDGAANLSRRLSPYDICPRATKHRRDNHCTRYSSHTPRPSSEPAPFGMHYWVTSTTIPARASCYEP